MAQVSHVLARLRRNPIDHLPIGDRVNQLLDEHQVVWRDRLLPPMLTLRLFLIQILNGNCSIAALRQLGGISFAVSSYCEARARLPLQLLQSLLQWVNEQAQEVMSQSSRLRRRIFVVDGSSYSMQDTAEHSAHYDHPPGAKVGVGYPMGKILGLLDLASGMFTSLLALPLFEHDARSGLLVHSMLKAGDILVGDRAFCTFAHLAMLQMRGIYGCMRLHQKRKNQTRGRQTWNKSNKAPAWLTPEQFAVLPQCITVRIVEYVIEQKGFRTRRVLIATTLLDEGIWSDAKIAELYGHRWQIETCFNHLKTTMKMNVLRCKTLEGVKKELAIYLLAYNLIRLMMLGAAQTQNVSVWRISFIDVMRWLAVKMIGLSGVDRFIVNPDRRGRCQLRVLRRRMKEYDLLTRPRREAEAQVERGKAIIH
jgi:hypothetical protein